MRVLLEPRARARGCPPTAAARAPSPGPGPRSRSMWTSSDSVIWLADAHDRVERRHRVLEHHRHLGAPVATAARPAPSSSRRSPSKMTSPVRSALAGQQAHDRAGQHRLAPARLADDAEGAAPVERERHAVDGPHQAPGRAEVGREVVDLEQARRRPGGSPRRVGGTSAAASAAVTGRSPARRTGPGRRRPGS